MSPKRSIVKKFKQQAEQDKKRDRETLRQLMSMANVRGRYSSPTPRRTTI